MGNKLRACRRAVFVLLLLSLILQLVCVIAPGWIVVSENEEERYVATFYITTCTQTSCDTRTKVDIHQDVTNSEHSIHTRIAADAAYHIQITEQVGMIVIFVSTLLTYILQLYKLFDSEGNFATISFVASSCLSFTAGLMLVILSIYYVMTNTSVERSKLDGFDMGFPYCVLLYTVAFVTKMLAVVLFMIEAYQLNRRV